MRCFHPVELQTTQGPQEVRCGHCLACLAHRQAEWTSRLQVEFDKFPDQCYFVTLTYAPERVPQKIVDLSENPVNVVSKEDVQKFHADLRKRFQQGFYMDDTLVRIGARLTPERIILPDCHFRYYLTSEYGPRGARPHYHGVYIGLPDDEYKTAGLIEAVWRNGFSKTERADSAAAAAYVAKYLVNDSLVERPEGTPKPFALMSKKIGSSYLDNHKLMEWHRMDPSTRAYMPVDGSRAVLPRYLRDKIFVDPETGEDLRPIIQAGSAARSAARAAAESELSRAELAEKRLQEYEREQEAIRQAEWRFRKNSKIK